MSNGFVVYSGKSKISKQPIVALLVGTGRASKNDKTGKMLQLYILPQRVSPLRALKSNNNEGACGKCALQGYFDPKTGRMINRVCYVNVGQAPEGIWKAYKRGSYPRYDHAKHADQLRGREIRLGAYGDPAALPVKLIRRLARLAGKWTGYSHQLFWIDQRRASALAEFCMCSCETLAQDAEAKRRGWRTFTVVTEAAKAPADSIECPFYSHNVQCIDCGLCAGTSRPAKSIYVISHGKAGNNLPNVQ